MKKFISQNLTRYQYIQTFVTSLGIPGFEFCVGCSLKELKCCSLTGPKKLKLFRNIDIRTLLPNISDNKCQQIQHLWDELLQLNLTISKTAAELSNNCIAEFERRARNWGEKFVAVYQRRKCHTIHSCFNETCRRIYADR